MKIIQILYLYETGVLFGPLSSDKQGTVLYSHVLYVRKLFGNYLLHLILYLIWNGRILDLSLTHVLSQTNSVSHFE